jgi:hypothetical protein
VCGRIGQDRTGKDRTGQDRTGQGCHVLGLVALIVMESPLNAEAVSK